MALSKKESQLVKDISKKYGTVIDLQRSPGVLIEILHNYGRVLDNGVGGTGGVNTVSTIAVGITPPDTGVVQLADLMRAILKVQRAVQAIAKKVGS